MADLQANSQNPEIAQTQTDRESSDDCVTHKEKGRTNSEDTGSSLAWGLRKLTMGGSRDGCNDTSRHSAIEHFYMEAKRAYKICEGWVTWEGAILQLFWQNGTSPNQNSLLFRCLTHTLAWWFRSTWRWQACIWTSLFKVDANLMSLWGLSLVDMYVKNEGEHGAGCLESVLTRYHLKKWSLGMSYLEDVPCMDMVRKLLNILNRCVKQVYNEGKTLNP